jgi:hypothetical protein
MILLKCGGPHPDPKKPSDTCNSPVMSLPKVIGGVSFAGTVRRIPDEPDGKIYGICPRCKTVNKFIFTIPASYSLPDETVARLKTPT